MKNPHHLLLIRFSALGDVAMLVPVIRCLYQTYPDLIITFLGRPFTKPLFREFENFNFHPVDFGEKHKGIKGLWRLFKELKNIPFSGIADLHSVLRTHLLSLFFKLTFFKVKKIHKGRREKHLLTRSVNKKFQPLTPTVYRYTDVFRKLGFPVKLDSHEFSFKREFPKSILTHFEAKNKKWIGIAPFASFEGKMYPLDQMQQVIASLEKKFQIFLFGAGAVEKERLEVWERSYENVYSTIGRVSFEDQLDLMPHLDLMISMDSANGHLAANYGISVLTLWGLTHPFCGFSPFNQPATNALLLDRKKYPKIPTSVFGNKIPKGYEEAFRSLTPLTVIEKTLEIIN